MQAWGHIGRHITKVPVDAGKHAVTALTRPGGKSKLPEGVSGVEANGSLVISLAFSGAPPDLQTRIAAAAATAGVPYVMPNTYINPVTADDISDVASNGMSAFVNLACAFWYEWSLATGEQWLGFTIGEHKATFFNDGRRSITVSTWDQCGRAVAALLSLPESGASPSLADFRNRDVPIYSFRVSQRDMLDSLHRVLGATDADWEITYEPTAKRIQDGTAEMASGKLTGLAKVLLFRRVFDPSSATSDYAATAQTANEALGLPKEDLDEGGRRAVEMVIEKQPSANTEKGRRRP
ncbi:hypothetical protein N657DRAFT_655659 [Parathielavia appendiculata]|uniref:NmrA-like domain-containing protein n=1 Tax=Parathielavia appendiculata TaxID=2587402 RepID=A0AAN6Z400_9PEZI|nr:hypothetical protein N657DRAFT_655659 [Parathielavia appendiculata]